MTILHNLRRAALRVGVDVRRADATPPARLAQLLRTRSVECVLDVGASHGDYGKQLRQFGYDGGIRSFEPLPEAYASLARHTARDPDWSTYHYALGAEDGVVSLNVAGNERATSSSVLPMLSRHSEAAPHACYVRAIDVPIRRLDAIWNEVAPADARSFIKLDVQGYEGAVLDGASKALDRVVGLQVEISLVPLFGGALSLRETLDRVEGLGMHLVHVEPGFADPRTGELLQMDGVFLRPVAR